MFSTSGELFIKSVYLLRYGLEEHIIRHHCFDQLKIKWIDVYAQKNAWSEGQLYLFLLNLLCRMSPSSRRPPQNHDRIRVAAYWHSWEENTSAIQLVTPTNSTHTDNLPCFDNFPLPIYQNNNKWTSSTNWPLSQLK